MTQINTQKPWPSAKAESGFLLAVHSIFFTLQGEGPFAGSPAVFLRLAGCNLQCPHCDTEYTQGAIRDNLASIMRSVQAEAAGRTELVVLTGGEPFRQHVVPLVKGLIALGLRVQIETNGTAWNDGIRDTGATIVCSPKAGKLHPDLVADAFKYVVAHGHIDADGYPTQVLGKRVAVARPPEGFPRAAIYVQPEDNQSDVRNKEHLEAAVAVSMKHGFRLCLQLHKLLDLP